MKRFGMQCLLAGIVLLGCHRKPLGVCGITETYEGAGAPSRLLRYKTRGFMDTICALAIIQVNYQSQADAGSNAAPGVGVTLQFRKPGSDSLVLGGVCDRAGHFQTYLNPGKYDILFSYYGCNGLFLKNMSLKSGEIKEMEVLLGRQGKESSLYEIKVDSL